MAWQAKYEELDDDTRAYLADVRGRKGEGTPGVFARRLNPWPLIGAIGGPLVILATMGVTWGTSLIYGDPVRLALLQTAGLVLGGWMIWAAVRSWLAVRGPKWAGFWVYCDPLNVYEAKGEQLTINSVADVGEVKAYHARYPNGMYRASLLHFKLGTGKKEYYLIVRGEQKADDIAKYYNYLAWARGPEGGGRAHTEPARLGRIAAYVVDHEYEPQTEEQLGLEIAEIPKAPMKANVAPPVILPYLVLALATVTCFLGMARANVPARDESLFRLIRETRRAPQIRAYLFDPRNTLHRDDAEKMLAPLYDQPTGEVRQAAKDPVVMAGMLALLDDLRTADVPVVSIRVREDAPPDEFGSSRAVNLRDRLASGIAGYVGPELLVFVDAPEGLPAHVEFTYKLVPEAKEATAKSPISKDNPTLYHVVGTLVIRPQVGKSDPTQKAYTASTAFATSVPDFMMLHASNMLLRDLIGVERATVGGGPAPPPAEPKK